jgi:hypothetical protein
MIYRSNIMAVHNSGERDIDAEMKQMWDSAVSRVEDVYRTTKTRIRAIEVKLEEHDGFITRLKRNLFSVVKENKRQNQV